jgi:hypothetical protein
MGNLVPRLVAERSSGFRPEPNAETGRAQKGPTPAEKVGARGFKENEASQICTPRGATGCCPAHGIHCPKRFGACLLAPYNFLGVSRKPWLCPFRVPDPTIWPQMLIPVAELSTQPELAEIRVFRSCIPLLWVQMKGRPMTSSGPKSPSYQAPPGPPAP